MNILAAESDIVSKLTSDLSGVKVESYPERPNNYRLIHPNGAVLVRYAGSYYDDSVANRNKETDQRRVLEWAVSVLNRNLHSHKGSTYGIYTLIEAVRESLTGYTVNSLTQSTVLIPTRDQFVTHAGGVWEHEILFSHSIPEVESFQ